MKTKISKLFILTILILTAQVTHATSWDTAGNVVTGTEKIGTINNVPFKMMVGNAERMQLNTDGIRFNGANPIFALLNNNGQFTFLHNTTNGCTAMYANISTVPKILNLCTDGLTLTGGYINARTKYVVYPDGGTYVLTPTDYTVEFTNGGDAVIPSATPANTGKHYEVINPSTGTLPMHTDNGTLIGNLNTEAEYQVQPGQAVTIVSNGSMWRVAGSKN